MQYEISLGFLWRSFKKCWILMVICALAVALVAGILVSVLVPKQYSSSVKFFVQNNSSTSDVVNQSTLSATEQLINDYVEFIKSDDDFLEAIDGKLADDAFVDTIEEQLNANKKENEKEKISKSTRTTLKNITQKQIPGMISSSSKSLSSCFTIKVTHTDPMVAYVVAYAIESEAPLAATQKLKSDMAVANGLAEACIDMFNAVGNNYDEWSLRQPPNYEATVQAYINSDEKLKTSGITGKELADIMDDMAGNGHLFVKLDMKDTEAVKSVEEYLKSLLLKNISPCFTTITAPKFTDTPESPDVPQYMLIGAAAAAIVVYAIVVLRGLFDMNIANEEDIKRLIDRPVIGTIPSWETNADAAKAKK